MFKSFNKIKIIFSNSAISNHGFSATDISVGNSGPITEEASDDYVSPASAPISTASDFGSSSAADLSSTSDVSPQQSPDDNYGTPVGSLITIVDLPATGSYSGSQAASNNYNSPVASTDFSSPGSSATGSFSSPVKNQLMVMSHQSDLHYQIVTV